MPESKAWYRNMDCPNCGRRRVHGPAMGDEDGVCEKCHWDVDANKYATVSRPENYRNDDDNNPFAAKPKDN